MVASTDAHTSFDLQDLARQLNNAEYEPARFPGLIYHLIDPKGALIFFNNGKIVLTGVKNLDTVDRVMVVVMKMLKNLGINVLDTFQLEIQNITASCDLQKLLNLNAIAITLGHDRVEYEPDRFEALVYRTRENPIISLLFPSGKIVCTGATRIEDVEIAINEFLTELNRTGLMT